MYPKKEFRFPTVLGLLLIGLMIGGLTILNPATITRLMGRARSPEGVHPEHIRVSNISDSSMVISWTTQLPIQGEIRYREGNSSEQTAYDIRDSDEVPKTYNLHYVELTGLTPDTPITFHIFSGGANLYSGTQTTGPSISGTLQVLPINGEIETQGSLPVEEAIVFATIGGSQLWSTFVANSNSWVIPIARIRADDLARLYCMTEICDDQTRVSLEVIGKSTPMTLTTTLGQSRPVQPFIFGDTTEMDGGGIRPTPTPFTVDLGTMLIEDEDTGEAVRSAHTSAPTPTKSVLSVSDSTEQDWPVSILNPKKNAKLSFPKPLIRGQGVPDTEVTIRLDSSVAQVGKANVRADGTWHWTPVFPLEPGEHTVTIETTGAGGQKISRSHTFYILKSGQQVLQAATGSATLTPTQIPTATPTPTVILAPSITSSPTPTLLPSPTSTPTIFATATPSPTLVVSGGFIPSMIVVAGGAMLLLLAFVLL